MSPVQSLSKDQITGYQDAFNLFDLDGDGLISSNELAALMNQVGLKPTAQMIAEMIKLVDTDSSGTIDFNEFLTMMTSQNVNLELELKQVFESFDGDGSGSINALELRSAMDKLGEKLSDEEIGEIMGVVDCDGNKEISFEEFRKMMMST